MVLRLAQEDQELWQSLATEGKADQDQVLMIEDLQEGHQVPVELPTLAAKANIMVTVCFSEKMQ